MPHSSEDWDADDWDNSDDECGLDALDFDTSVLEDGYGLDALPEHHAGQDIDRVSGPSGSTAYDDYAVEAVAVDTVDVIDDEARPEDNEQIPLVQVTNPPGTVTVRAYLDGSIAQLDLEPKVVTLTESDLAEEICFVAAVAAKRATAALHNDAVNMLVEQGMAIRDAQDFVETNMPYATPEQAGEAERALMARHFDQ